MSVLEATLPKEEFKVLHTYVFPKMSRDAIPNVARDGEGPNDRHPLSPCGADCILFPKSRAASDSDQPSRCALAKAKIVLLTHGRCEVEQCGRAEHHRQPMRCNKHVFLHRDWMAQLMVAADVCPRLKALVVEKAAPGREGTVTDGIVQMAKTLDAAAGVKDTGDSSTASGPVDGVHETATVQHRAAARTVRFLNEDAWEIVSACTE